MKKSPLLVALCGLALCLPAHGQSFWRNCEIEAGPSVMAASASLGGKFEPSWCLFAEARYNFPRVPLDAGIRFGLGALNRAWTDAGADVTYHYKSLQAVADYQFCRGKNVAPFVGMGIGWVHHKDDRWLPAGHTTLYSNGVWFTPRIGVELFRVVRLTVGWNVAERPYRSLECGLGLVLGGWKRR